MRCENRILTHHKWSWSRQCKSILMKTHKNADWRLSEHSVVVTDSAGCCKKQKIEYTNITCRVLPKTLHKRVEKIKVSQFCALGERLKKKLYTIICILVKYPLTQDWGVLQSSFFYAEKTKMCQLHIMAEIFLKALSKKLYLYAAFKWFTQANKHTNYKKRVWLFCLSNRRHEYGFSLVEQLFSGFDWLNEPIIRNKQLEDKVLEKIVGTFFGFYHSSSCCVCFAYLITLGARDMSFY